MASLIRLPDAPSDFTPQQKEKWSTLIRELEKVQKNFLFGNPSTIQVEQLKDGVLAKGFTTVSSTYYTKQLDGTILADASASSITVFLTTAKDSKNAQKTIKKTTAGNLVLIRDMTSALIDGAVVATLSAINNSYTLTCDGAAWWITGKV